jgi:type II secretory pathway pseudopilin PulG
MHANESNRTLWVVLAVVGAVGVLAVILVGGIVCAGVLVVAPMRAEQAQNDECLNRIAQLDAAVNAYYLKNGKWPPDLDTLLDPGPDGSPPLIDDPGLLLDPWGDPFEYDVTGAQNSGTRPDIWADRHDPVGNWQLPPPPTPPKK